MSEYAEIDSDKIKFREESHLLLMKSSERINFENSGMFLKSLIEEKINSSQKNECKLYDFKLVFV